MPRATIGEIASFLGGSDRVRWLGAEHPDHPVDRAVPIADAGPGAIAFLTAAAAAAGAFDGTAGGPAVLVLDRAASIDDARLRAAGVVAVLPSDRARLDFVRIAARFFAPPRASGVHESAVVAPTAVLGADVSIGPLCTVADGCRIGDGSRLEPGVHLYPDVVVGRNVHIHAGTVIGADGFGYERGGGGALEAFPHLGTVEIGDDVDIGANTCIDRASLGVTRVLRGAKIDNLVHVGHNVEIGEDAVVIALAMVGGSTRIGDRAWISPSAALRDNITIGEDATVGFGAVVTRDVPAGATVAGAPARDMREYRALLAQWRAALDAGTP